MADFFYLPISDLRKIAKVRFGRDLFRIGEGPLGTSGAFFPESLDDDPQGTPTPEGCCLALEDGTGNILQESGGGCIAPEFCADAAQACLIIEDGTGEIMQETGAGCIRQET